MKTRKVRHKKNINRRHILLYLLDFIINVYTYNGLLIRQYFSETTVIKKDVHLLLLGETNGCGCSHRRACKNYGYPDKIF